MNLTIDELERRLYAENRQKELAMLLEYEWAMDAAWDYLGHHAELTAEKLAAVPYNAMRGGLS